MVQGNSTENHSSDMDTSTGETTKGPGPITEVSEAATSHSETHNLEKTTQIQPSVASIAQLVPDPSSELISQLPVTMPDLLSQVIFTSEMRVVASEKGRKESVAIRMKFDIPETDFQLLLAWVGRSGHQSIE